MSDSRNGTLTAATVATVPAFVLAYGTVEIVNVDGADVIYFRADGVDPTVAGDGCRAIPAVAGASVLVRVADAANDVRLISSGTPAYCVTGLEPWEL